MRPSKRFTPSRWTEYLVPAVLVFLLLALIATVLIVLLFSAGIL
jgi:hypothetical protein